MPTIKTVSSFIYCVCIAVLTAGCSASSSGMHQSKDFERVTYSNISSPLNGGDYYWFDVKLSAEFPDDNPAAEQKRMLWLAGWLERRGLCANGYDIVERRPFEFLEHNPARYDLRYKVQCTVAPVEGA